MTTCSNCNSKLSCGCQKRTASDNRSVCTNCISKYENSLKVNRIKSVPTTNHIWGANRKNK